MKCQLLQENLIKALTRTGRIISSKTQLPVLQNALLSTEDGRLRVTTSNMEMSISTFVGAKTEKEGSACVSSKLLTELVTSLPQETITIEDKEGSLLVSTTRTHATLAETPASEFPPVDIKNKRQDTFLDAPVLLGALGNVLFAAATDEGRPVLTGVKLTTQDGELTLVATDGYRLSVKKVAYKTEKPIDMIVPARALGEVVKIASEEKEIEELSFGKTADGQLSLSTKDTTILARLIDGEFPDYVRIIPKTHTTSMVVDKNEFLQAVKSASIFARDNSNIIKLAISKDGIIISANTPQVGQNTVNVDAKTKGDDAEIAFNSRFLLEFLNNFQEDELRFEMTGSLNPGVFKPVKDDSFLHIIMPVRVQG